MGIYNYIKTKFKTAQKPPFEQDQRRTTLAKVEMYSTPICPYCLRAKALLNQKGVAYRDINVMINPAKRQEMTQRSGGRTVPQIFIDDKAIGGCDEMFDLDYDGELDTLLGLK